MKICLVSQEYPPETGGGGIGTQTYLKAQGLSARGHEVHVVSASWDRKERTYNDGNVTIHRIAEPDLGLAGFESSTYWLAYSTDVAKKLHALTQEIVFDVIQFPEYGGEGFIFQTDTFRYRTAAYIVQLHGPLAMFAEYQGWPDRDSTLYQIGCFMERTVIHHADRVIASSHNSAAFCADNYGYPLKEIAVIHSAVDTAIFYPRPVVQDENGPRVLFVGNFVGSKGITNLVKAVLKIRARYPSIRLRAIGKGEADFLKSLERLIATAGAQSNFEFLGYVPYAELPNHYAWCDFFAGPSTHEPGPGNIYLEAMACAKPVIACRSGGAPEVVLDGETGLLVAPQATDDLVHAIRLLSEDAKLRKRLGENGRGWIERQFTVEKYIDRVERIYQDVRHEKAQKAQMS